MIYDKSQLENKKCKDVNVECSHCKTQFLCERRLVQRALREKKEKYCSHRCSSLAQKKERVNIVCAFCQNIFERLESAGSKNVTNYCSHTCRAKHQNRTKEEEKVKAGIAAIFTCVECGISKRCNPYSISTKKFCSRMCRSVYNYKKYKIAKPLEAEKAPEIIYDTIKKCPSCKKDFLIYPPSDYKKRKYCSGYCRNKENNKLLDGSRSKAEQLLEQRLLNKFPHEEILFNNRNILDGLELDVYFPKLKLAIEWNGVYHYKQIRDEKSFIRTQTTDAKKQQLCWEKGITLLVIKDLTSNKKFIENEISKLIEYVESVIIE